MFTKQQLTTAYREFVIQSREHPEKFLTAEEALESSIEEEAVGVVDFLFAIMEGRDPFED